jgi:predicted phosphohydrolase
MEIDRFTGGILPRVKLPDSEKMVIDRLWRDPERRVRPFSEQDFRLYYPEGKDMRKTTDSAEKVRSVIGGKSGQSYF